MAGKIMIYGANGYTGTLIAKAAVSMGLAPVLSGRNGAAVGRLANELGLEARPVSLEDSGGLAKALDGIDVLVNAAGPFAETWAHATLACIETGTHYLDITGEPDVLLGCAELHEVAAAAGIVILPGVGFDVVPTDCVAAMLKRRLPDATRLTLAFGGMAQASRGTVRTMLNHIGSPVFVRSAGRIRPRSGPVTSVVDFGDGPQTVHAISWGDIATAWHTTSIPNIEVFVLASPGFSKVQMMGPLLRKLMTSFVGKVIGRAYLRTMAPGPDEHTRQTSRTRVYGRVENETGESVELRLETPEGYALTGVLAARIAAEVLAGKVQPGYQTPATALGADFILGIDGVSLRD